MLLFFTDVQLLISTDADEIDPNDLELKRVLGAGQFGVSSIFSVYIWELICCKILQLCDDEP